MAKSKPRKSKAKKNTAKKSTPDANLSAQLKIIDRMVETSDWMRAESKCREMLKLAPKHGGLWLRLVDLLEYTQQQVAAVLACYQWSQAQSGSARAAERLIESAASMNFPALVSFGIGRYLAVGGDPELMLVKSFDEEKWQDQLTSPFDESMDKDMALRLELGQLYLQTGEAHFCIQTLSGLDLAAARNNLALAHFHQGDATRARELLEKAAQDEPRNLLALGWACKLALYTGDLERYEVLGKQLETGEALRDSDALTQLEVLLWHGGGERAWRLFQDYQNKGWERIDYHWITLGAACAVAAGDPAAADDLLTKASHIKKAPEQVFDNHQDLNLSPGDRRGQRILGLKEVLPRGLLNNLVSAAQDSDPMLGRMCRVAAPISTPYWQHVYSLGDKAAASVAICVMKYRAEAGEPGAEQALFELLRKPADDNASRFSLMRYLKDQGFSAPGEPLSIWDGEEVREVVQKEQIINTEPKPSKLSEADEEKMGDALELCFANRFEEALPVFAEMLETYPDETSLYANLAGIYEHRGDKQKARELLERALEVDPDYLIGRANLAKFDLFDGDLAGAQAWLGGVVQLDVLHVDEAFALYTAYFQLYVAKREFSSAQNSLDQLGKFPLRQAQEKSLPSLQSYLNAKSGGQ